MKSFISILVFCAVFFLGNYSAAAPDNSSKEFKSIELMMVYCLSATVANDSAARLAEMKKLPELPQDKSMRFSGGQPARTFAHPEVMGNTVMTAYESGICSVAIKELDPAVFIPLVDHWFGPETPFKLINEKDNEKEIERQYKADFKGNVLLLINMRKEKPTDGGLQGLLTISRTKD